jgi:protein O-GlcNAc transferase
MANLTLILDRAVAAYNSGKLVEAEQLCQQIIAAKHNFFEALRLLAVVQSRLGKRDEALSIYDRALAVRPDYAELLSNRGLTLHDLKRFEEALASYDRALAVRPDYAEALSNRGLTLHELKRFEEALESYDGALSLRPDYAEALSNRGLTLHELKRFEEALESYKKAISFKPDHVKAFNNRGNVLKELKRLEEALASYDQAIKVWPEFAEALSNRGVVLHDLKRFDEALTSYERALSVRPDYPEALFNRGITLKYLKRYDEALASYDRVIAVRPDYAEALSNRGNILQELKRWDEALASYDRALKVRPDYAEALSNRGNTLKELKRLDKALASYDRALNVRPDYAEALSNRGLALHELKRLDEALSSYDRALKVRPGFAEALSNRGNTLKELKRLDEALASYDRALAVNPDHIYAFSGAADCVIKLCDWKSRLRFAGELGAHISGKKSIIAPFLLLGYSADPALLEQCARNYIENAVPSLPKPLWTGANWYHDKLRIAYLSADFHRHATAYLMAELFERHDRSRFEIIGISFGVDDRSEIRKRLVEAFDQFHDVSRRSDEEAAKLLYDLQVDIAVDLKGYTQDSRPGILAHRPVPIQVSYLGYPGTLGAEFIDYIVADKIVVPFEQQRFYSEKIVHLPDCYQVNDRKRKISQKALSRQEMGLPEQQFVFCCFNNNWKITPEVFEVWIRLLHAVDGSVLWLLSDSESAQRNLRNEAQKRGIDPSRLVFAARSPLDLHLARHHLADLFLDTLPVNAHTAASDALWMGLPVLTCIGNTFAGRVCASLLNAIGLPELVTSSLADYEMLALKLATDASLLQSVRQRLKQNRLTYPLFDTDRFRRHIEAAYTTMWGIWQGGESPHSFSVEPIS